MTLEEIVKARRSVRRFTGEPGKRTRKPLEEVVFWETFQAPDGRG